MLLKNDSIYRDIYQKFKYFKVFILFIFIYNYKLLADLGKARGCSINSLMIN